MNLQAFSDSNLLNYKINKRKKLAPLNQKIFNSNIGSIFHKKNTSYIRIKKVFFIRKKEILTFFRLSQM